MRKLCGKVSKAGTVVILINQVREKIGMVFGNPETTTGGRALKFYASIRLEVRRVAASKDGTIKEGDEIVGHRMHIKATKNKVDFPFRETSVSLLYGSGFDKTEDLINHALKIKVLTGSAWYVILGSDKKYRREDLPLAELKAAVFQYYANQQEILERGTCQKL
jgi:recombination protein RecA